jgi:hypothetical protein
MIVDSHVSSMSLALQFLFPRLVRGLHSAMTEHRLPRAPELWYEIVETVLKNVDESDLGYYVRVQQGDSWIPYPISQRTCAWSVVATSSYRNSAPIAPLFGDKNRLPRQFTSPQVSQSRMVVRSHRRDCQTNLSHGFRSRSIFLAEHPSCPISSRLSATALRPLFVISTGLRHPIQHCSMKQTVYDSRESSSTFPIYRP